MAIQGEVLKIRILTILPLDRRKNINIYTISASLLIFKKKCPVTVTISGIKIEIQEPTKNGYVETSAQFQRNLMKYPVYEVALQSLSSNQIKGSK